jgi:hypothetical protein
VVYSPSFPLHGKNWAFFFLMESIKEKIVTAMTFCGMGRISEGALYYSLFKIGAHYDDATMAIQELLDNGVLYRNGGIFILTTHGKEDSNRGRSFCIS